MFHVSRAGPAGASEPDHPRKSNHIGTHISLASIPDWQVLKERGRDGQKRGAEEGEPSDREQEAFWIPSLHGRMG